MPQADIPALSNELSIRQGWVKARIANLSPTAQKMLKVTWPEGCPKLVECDNTQLDKLVAAIQVVEAEHDIPFFDADPTAKKPAKRKMKGFDTAEIGSIQ
jgi:hypothetical protein